MTCRPNQTRTRQRSSPPWRASQRPSSSRTMSRSMNRYSTPATMLSAQPASLTASPPIALSSRSSTFHLCARLENDADAYRKCEYARRTYQRSVTCTVVLVTSSGRICRSCGAHLASDNPDDRCGPCQRREPALQLEPPKLDDACWDAPAIQQAVAERHFGHLLLAYRKAVEPELRQA